MLNSGQGRCSIQNVIQGESRWPRSRCEVQPVSAWFTLHYSTNTVPFCFGIKGEKCAWGFAVPSANQSFFFQYYEISGRHMWTQSLKIKRKTFHNWFILWKVDSFTILFVLISLHSIKCQFVQWIKPLHFDVLSCSGVQFKWILKEHEKVWTYITNIDKYIILEDHTALIVKSIIFCDMRPCSLVEVYRRFWGIYSFKVEK
jgi:hypothetical protein